MRKMDREYMVVVGAEGTSGFRVNSQEAINAQEENGENVESESIENGEKQKNPNLKKLKKKGLVVDWMGRSGVRESEG